MPKIRVLMVCMGNICRSPMAHGVFAERIREAGLEHAVEVDSAGTHSYHVGEPPDRRAQATARARGYELSGQRARRLVEDDFRDFDYVLVMDDENLRNARALQPTDGTARLHRFLEFAGSRPEREVPDPYYGGSQGFATVMDLVEEAATGFLSHLRQRHGL
ncbi:low molecular weight protein-tyrosine-phosphatase [Thioalkalivibrio sp.]|uniref:low molecular weight protein-tyrosine-phosphatase n=1 Tax=Thioalkalivibrio sp. TaxID=2093813 RepID=UPI0012D51FFF|nr:low molecular weight protein-tyrosine-phosphatase [Thioalkalivibrio sp.]TVP82570.1 MAG: low molecular weight phosphotyrosine protein phosphatase [Thioalkalivibrio sp.]